MPWVFQRLDPEVVLQLCRYHLFLLQLLRLSAQWLQQKQRRRQIQNWQQRKLLGIKLQQMQKWQQRQSQRQLQQRLKRIFAQQMLKRLQMMRQSSLLRLGPKRLRLNLNRNRAMTTMMMTMMTIKVAMSCLFLLQAPQI